MIRSRTLLTGGAIVALIMLLAAVLAPWLAPHDPLTVHVARRLEAPSATFPLGTDELGRCVLSRALVGARTSLLLTLAGVAGALALGTLIGGAAGFAGGMPDLATSGVTDLFLALPRFVLALVVVGLVGPTLTVVALVLVLVDWTAYARVARSTVLAEKHQPWILAEQAIGCSNARILFRSLLPAALPPLGVYAVLRLGGTLMALAGLGFLGLGAPPPTPEWGAMIGQGRIYLRSAPWIVLVPSLLMVISILGFTVLGEGLRGHRSRGD